MQARVALGDVVKTYCPAAGITEIVADTGDGDDRIVLTVAIPARVDAGADDDRVDNYGGAATVQLGAGDDLLLTDKKATTTAFGGDGDDDLSCSDDRFNRFKEERTYDGGAGKDRLCGARGDLLEGEDESDTIVGGGGEDEIEGGAGKDVIRARDRERDDVDGGSKRDTVHADRADDLTRCEIVRRR